MMQEPEISLEAGMTPDTMVDELGAIMNKYEVPMGLMNKLMMLSEFESLEFIIDDSGSMSLMSDTVNPSTGLANTRWQEAQQRLKEMIEVLAYVPFTQIDIVFLKREILHSKEISATLDRCSNNAMPWLLTRTCLKSTICQSTKIIEFTIRRLHVSVCCVAINA
jgi:hypothetical protein